MESSRRRVSGALENSGNISNQQTSSSARDSMVGIALHLLSLSLTFKHELGKDVILWLLDADPELLVVCTISRIIEESNGGKWQPGQFSSQRGVVAEKPYR